MATENGNETAIIRARGSIFSSLIDGAVSIYQTERTIRANEKRDQKQREFEKELEELRHRNQQQLDLEAFNRQKQLQQELATYNRQTQLEIAAQQRKTALESVEAHKLFENWPLRIVPSLILDSHRGDGPIPLRVIPVPPVIDCDRFATNAGEFPPIEKYLAEGLRQFLHQNYFLNDTVRPVELLDGAWDSNRYHGGSSIKALFSMLQSEPILILESEIDGDYLNFRLGYWGLGQENYSYAPVITRLPFREIIYESAKTRALAWKAARDKIVSLGQNPKVINELDTYNLEIIEQEAALEEAGIDLSELPRRYRVNNQDFEVFAQFLVICNCLVAAWIGDTHHLIQNNVTPLLPQLLPELAGEIPEEIIQSILSGYDKIYQFLEGERLEMMPELLLDFAHSLNALPDKSWARCQVDNSLKSWLKLRGVTLSEEKNVIDAMQPLLMPSEDKSYVEDVGECLTEIGDEPAVSNIQALLYGMETTLNDAENHYQSALTLAKQVDYRGALAALERAISLNPNEPKFRNFRQQLPKSVGSYQFDVVTVNFQGEEVKREQKEAQYFTEKLGNDIKLEMIAIPGGKFMMGSPEGEGRDDEKPQHQVTVQPFFMSKYPITQAQYQQI
ncbi:MAG: SUMF1/EgtB/PvdO family nonheme iron enzyme, partial [Xenococcus sp. (in: cyanobacteria)]